MKWLIIYSVSIQNIHYNLIFSLDLRDMAQATLGLAGGKNPMPVLYYLCENLPGIEYNRSIGSVLFREILFC